MPVIRPTNFAKAGLASPPSGTGGLSFTVTAGKGALFPSPGSGEYFYGVFTNAGRTAYEVVKVEARSTDAFTIAASGRGQDGTSAATWTTSDIFYLPTTHKMWEEIGAFTAAAIALHGLTPAADRLPYFSGATTAALATFTSFGRSLVDDADAAAGRTTLGATATGGSLFTAADAAAGRTALGATATGSSLFTAATASAALAVLIPAGTKMLFQQTAAPTGWTKDTTHNNKALRLVSGTASSGGATAFTTVFGSGKLTGGTAITISQMPSHQHTEQGMTAGGGTSGVALGAGSGPGNTNNSTDFTGGGAAHDHTLSLDLQYVDVIVATKD